MTALRTKALAALAATSLAALSLTAGPALAQSAPKDGGTLVMGTVGVPRHFDGAIQSGIATALPSTQIFASPLRYDKNWDPEPYLAKSWEVAKDGKSVTLHLVDNAKFSDGTPVTAEDVKFSIETIKKYHPFKTMLAPVTTVDTPDKYTVVIHLAHPYPALLLAMSPALMPILPEHVYGKGDIQTNPANLKPVGSGPFKLVSYKQGDSYVLEKNPDFFLKGRPHLDKIIVKIFADPENMVLAVQNGEVDVAPLLSDVRDIQRLEKAPDVTVSNKGFEAIGPINWLEFNTKKKPFDDVRVRQAIGYAINKKFIVDRLLGGVAKRAYGPIAPGSPLATTDVNHYDYNPKKANELLDEAGLKKGADGTRFTMTVDYIPGSVDIGRNVVEYMRSALRQVGIKVEVRTSPDFPTWSNRISNYDFDLTEDDVYNWGDPVIGVARTYLSSNIRKGVVWANMAQYDNPKVDKLLNEAAVEGDPAKRKELYAEFQKIVVGDAPILFLNTVPFAIAYKKGLENVPAGIWGSLQPWDNVYWSKKN
ncbi:ABC transporter substrate-binding protein [Acidimangrovimonas sediminis]|uniref:ABC transporter substrate-binding protein n=1 Tax=Acidimangrovimonas sediminis TaxID=2056283 RepID=UPI000C8022CB|nr:ABC transporter substrate-binding protein [Acidimangrovimonas sediminis]